MQITGEKMALRSELVGPEARIAQDYAGCLPNALSEPCGGARGLSKPRHDRYGKIIRGASSIASLSAKIQPRSDA
jgi:hypothetical protein